MVATVGYRQTDLARRTMTLSARNAFPRRALATLMAAEFGDTVQHTRMEVISQERSGPIAIVEIRLLERTPIISPDAVQVQARRASVELARVAGRWQSPTPRSLRRR